MMWRTSHNKYESPIKGGIPLRKLALLGASFLTAFTLAGCGGDEEGLRDNNGLQPTGYGDGSHNAPNTEQINMDADEFGPDYYNGLGLNDNNQNSNFTENENNGNFHNNGVNRDSNRGRNNGTNNDYSLADRVADRITSEVDDVDQAYVFTGPENAYVAVVLDENKELTDEVQKRIQQVVKNTDQDIDDVFISANPDFTRQARDYANQYDEGEPVEGFFEEMGDMFERIFPNNN